MFRRVASLIHTFTFRLGLVYVGLLCVSAVILFAFIYTFATNYLEQQMRESIKIQYSYLLSEYHDSGSYGVEARIRELIATDPDASEVYLLVDKDSKPIAGNLNEWPQSAEPLDTFEKNGHWVRFRIENQRAPEKDVTVVALTIPLSKWRSLLIGQSLRESEWIENTILQTFYASLLVIIVVALIGALIMTRSVILRINTINRSALTIMQGNFSARIPFRIGGDEFDHLSENLNMMLDKIEMLMQSIGQFANSIAHDLRTPLNRIIIRLDAGMRSLSAENTAKPMLEQNIREMESLVETFNAILKISELENNAHARQFERCDVQIIVNNVVELYEPYASERGIDLRSEISEPVWIMGEKILLTQAIANLLDNAIKFSPPQESVRIWYEMVGEQVHLLIADRGPGIPKSYRDRVFEKFFRLELARSSPGNGLGLSLVAAIARIHDASIQLEDHHPGLIVRIIFPKHA